jgi:hypothetical protein
MKLSVVPLLLVSSASINAFSILLHSTKSVTKPSISWSSIILWYGPEESQDETMMMMNNLVITSPVLRQVYPALLEWKQTYGHPNIPLGSKEGRQCQTLRRLHIQNKLLADEVAWLKQLGFIFTSLEDVYREADFDEMFQRLMNYEQEHPNNNFQIAKKCPSDPELGAWVTGIRRLAQEGVDPLHSYKLNQVGFAWISTRKCGSKFMDQYRKFIDQVQEQGREAVLSESKPVNWIKAQQEVLKRGTLSHTRVHYLADLFGEDWTTVGRL